MWRKQTLNSSSKYAKKTEQNTRFWEPLTKVDLGPTTKAGLLSLKTTTRDKEVFADRCRQFLVELAKGIFLRFPFNSPQCRLLNSLSWIDPLALQQTKDVTEVAHFFGLDVKDVHREFKSLKRMFRNETETNVEKFWTKVANVINADESLKYPLLIDTVQRILVFWHSSATVERVFSQINLTKTKVRNSLNDNSLNGILHSKALLKNLNVFNIEYNKMTSLISSKMYDVE